MLGSGSAGTRGDIRPLEESVAAPHWLQNPWRLCQSSRALAWPMIADLMKRQQGGGCARIAEMSEPGESGRQRIGQGEMSRAK